MAKVSRRNTVRRPSGVFYFDMMHEGKRYFQSLNTRDPQVAAVRANVLREKIWGDRWEDILGTRPKRGVASIGEVIGAYERLAVGSVGEKGRTNNANALRLVVRRGLGDDGMEGAKVDGLSLERLTGELVQRFEQWHLSPVAGDAAGLESAKVTVRSYLRQARSLFTEDLLRRYERENLVVPDLKDFLKEKTAAPARGAKIPASDALLKRTWEAVPALRESNRAAYIAWLLGVCTLRAGEVRRAEWTWLQEIEGARYIKLPKANKSKIEKLIPLPPGVWEELAEWKQIRPADGSEGRYILPGEVDKWERASPAIDGVNTWMRSLGWETQHTLHEMRAYYLRQVMLNYGLESAQAVAGHAHKETTQNNYTGIKDVKGVVVPLPFLKVAPAGQHEDHKKEA